MDHSTFKGVRVRLKPPITPFRDNFRIADLNEAARAADAAREAPVAQLDRAPAL
jgi:hypothetical protein